MRARKGVRALLGLAAAVTLAGQAPSVRAAAVLGQDDRDLLNAYLNDAERRFYSGVGLIRCLTKAGRVNISTAFHAGSFATLVTTAHGLYSEGKRQRVSPKACHVIFYDAAGQPLEQLRVSALISRWDARGAFGDVSQDMAIVRLRRESRTPRHHYLYRAGAPLTEPERVTMVGFHFEIPNPTVLRKVEGSAYPPPPDFQHARLAEWRGRPLANPQALAVADYDTSKGTSGGPVFDARGRVIGINQGSAGGYSSVFNASRNYTLVVLFDDKFDADLKAMLARR